MTEEIYILKKGEKGSNMSGDTGIYADFIVTGKNEAHRGGLDRCPFRKAL